jgi:hypothetical protein
MLSSLNRRLNCIELAFGSWTTRSVQCKTQLIVGFRIIANALIEADYYPKVGQCSGILNAPECLGARTLARL